MASLGLGLGLGTEGLMKREVAGPVPFWMSKICWIRDKSGEMAREGSLPIARIVSAIAVVRRVRSVDVSPRNLMR